MVELFVQYHVGDRMEAEAEAAAELNEEATGDVLAHKLATLEAKHGGEEDLLALKQKMGLAPPPAAAPRPARVEAPSGLDAAEQEELAQALAELASRRPGRSWSSPTTTSR
jgi:hypothetical protein